MSSKIVNKQEELNGVTRDILTMTANMKKNLRDNMVSHENSIAQGISIFEEILKEINPYKIDDDIEKHIQDAVNMYMINKEERQQKINNYVHYGINNCFMMLYNYKKYINSAKYLKKTK